MRRGVRIPPAPSSERAESRRDRGAAAYIVRSAGSFATNRRRSPNPICRGARGRSGSGAPGRATASAVRVAARRIVVRRFGESIRRIRHELPRRSCASCRLNGASDVDRIRRARRSRRRSRLREATAIPVRTSASRRRIRAAGPKRRYGVAQWRRQRSVPALLAVRYVLRQRHSGRIRQRKRRSIEASNASFCARDPSDEGLPMRAPHCFSIFLAAFNVQPPPAP